MNNEELQYPVNAKRIAALMYLGLLDEDQEKLVDEKRNASTEFDRSFSDAQNELDRVSVPPNYKHLNPSDQAILVLADLHAEMVADGTLPAEEVQLAPETLRFATNAEPVGSVQASSDPASSKSDSTQSQRRDDHFYYDFDKTKNRVSVWVTKTSSVPKSKVVAVLVLDRENKESLFAGRLTMTEGEHRWFVEVPIDLPAKTKIGVKAGFEEHFRNE